MANEQNLFLRRLSEFIFFHAERRQEAQIRGQKLHLDLEAAEAPATVLPSLCLRDVLEHGKMALVHKQKAPSIFPKPACASDIKEHVFEIYC